MTDQWTVRTTMPDRTQVRVRIGVSELTGKYIAFTMTSDNELGPWSGRGDSPKEALINLRWHWRRKARLLHSLENR